MGQRLNITIWDRGNRLANSYYHWSGYTTDAYRILEKLIYGISVGYASVETDPYIYAIRLLEFTGAGLTEEEYIHASQSYPNLLAIKAVDRNEGLIATSEAGMNDTERWEEARINIYLDAKTFDFYVLAASGFKYFEQYSLLDPKSIPAISSKFSFSDIPFDRIYDLGEVINHIMKYGYVRYNKSILELIG